MTDFTNTEIIHQLDKLLDSPQLKGCPVLGKFLNYVVHEALEGRASNLKEYSIGITALGKSQDFDPQLDSIVRIHAGRLRRALNEYYYEARQGDVVRIVIPKGTYAPEFYRQDPEAKTPQRVEARTAGRPALILTPVQKEVAVPTALVLPFRSYAFENESIFAVIHERLSVELASLDDVRVLSYRFYEGTISAGELDNLPSALGVDHLISGTVYRIADTVRVIVQFITRDGRQLWAKAFDRSALNIDAFDFEQEIITDMVNAFTRCTAAKMPRKANSASAVIRASV